MADIAERKKGYGSLLLFFLLMLVFTCVSRIYDTWTVAKVRTAYAKAGTVAVQAEGSGRILAGETAFRPVEEGYRIEEVLVSPGEVVAEGAVLFRYQMESLKERQRQLETKREKLGLEKERVRLSAQGFSGITQVELADREVAAAARELEQGSLEYEQAQAESQERLEQLKEEYELRASILKEELLRQQERAYEAGLNHIGTSRNSRDAALREAWRTVEDLEEDLEGLEANESGEAQIEALRKKLARAREDAEELEELWEEQIDGERLDLDYLDDGQNRIQEGMTSAQVELRLGYEAEVEREADVLLEKEKEVETRKERLRDAQEKRQLAAREDEQVRLTKEQAARLADLSRREMELDQKELERELLAVEQLIEAAGAVTAPVAGTVLEAGLMAGQKTAGTELIRLGTGGLAFEGSFKTGTEEPQQMYPGDSLVLVAAGRNTRLETVIDSVDLLGEQGREGEETGTFLAEVPGEGFLIGERARYMWGKRSERYETVIPIGGLRKDQDGYYCLVVRVRNQVLGEEQFAERVDLTVLEKGNQEAAVDGALYQEDAIIVESNKMVAHGSRIRLVEEWR